MRNFDLTPLYRSSIGFDRVGRLLDNLANAERSQPNYPPYNIELTGEDHYRITMAVAGFDQSELNIESEQNNLVVRGNKSTEENAREFLHQGIAARDFERRFQLADHVRVTNASYVNGLLHIDLVRELPEVMKPRTIEIGTADPQTQKVESAKSESAKSANDGNLNAA